MLYVFDVEERRRPNPGAPCDGVQALEKAQNGNGRLLSNVGMDLGLAPRPLGFGAMSVWDLRRAGLASSGRLPTVNAVSARFFMASFHSAQPGLARVARLC
jgi:hypothetical protein